MSDKSDFLSQATNTADILRELARSVWAKTHNEECPSEHIPTEQDLLDYWPHLPADAMDAANERLTALQQHMHGGMRALFVEGGLLDKRLAELRRNPPNDRTPQELHFLLSIPQMLDESDILASASWVWEPQQNRLGECVLTAQSQDASVPHAETTLVHIQHFWAAMQDPPKHPLAPLVAAWQNRPEKVKPRGGSKGLIGAPFIHRRPSAATPAPPPVDKERLPHGATQLGHVEQTTFPSLIPKTGSERAPALLDALRKAGRAAGRGHVGYLPVIALEGMLDLRTEHRDGKTKSHLYANREILVKFIGMNTRQYRPSNRKGRSYRRALDRLSSFIIDLPNGGWYSPIIARGQSGMGLDDIVQLDLAMPPEAAVGPSIDRELLRRLRQSAPAWYMYIALVCHWDRHGGVNGQLIKPKLPDVLRNEEGYLTDEKGNVILDKGKPSTNWNHPRAVKVRDAEGYLTPRAWNDKALARYPVVGSDDLVRWAYGDIPTDRRLRHLYVKRAVAALERIERYGYDASERTAGDGRPNGCIIKREGAGFRVMPPDVHGQAVERRKARELAQDPRHADAVDADFELLD